MKGMGKDVIAVLNWGANAGFVAITGLGSVRLDAAADELAIIFRATKDMTIDEVAVHVSEQADAGGAEATYEISIQALDANGDSDGSPISSSNADFTPTAIGLLWIALGADVSLTQNEIYAIAINDGVGGGTTDATHYAGFGYWSNQFYNQDHLSISVDTGANWTPTNNVSPAYAVRNSGTTNDVMGFPTIFVNDFGALASGVGNIAAAKINIPVSLGRRVQVASLEIYAYSTGDYKLGIYDSSGTAIVETGKLDHDAILQNANYMYEAFEPVWLETGVDYYIGIKLDEASFATVVYGINTITADNRSAYSNYPANNTSVYTTAWADTTDEVVIYAALGVSAWDAHGEEMQHLDAGMNR